MMEQDQGLNSQPTPVVLNLASVVETYCGPAHSDTLSARDVAARRFRAAQDFKQAIAHEEESLKRRLKLKQTDTASGDDPILDNRMRLARDYSELGNSAAAIKHLRAVLRAFETHVPQDWSRIAETRNELIIELWKRGRDSDLIEAAEIGVRTLDEAVPQLGIDHGVLIDCRHNLGAALEKLESLEAAYDIFQENKDVLESMSPHARESKHLNGALEDAKMRLQRCKTEIRGRQNAARKRRDSAMREEQRTHNENTRPSEEAKAVRGDEECPEEVQHEQQLQDRNTEPQRKRGGRSIKGPNQRPTGDSNRPQPQHDGDLGVEESVNLKRTKSEEFDIPPNPCATEVLQQKLPSEKQPASPEDHQCTESQRAPDGGVWLRVPGAWPSDNDPSTARSSSKGLRRKIHHRSTQSTSSLRPTSSGSPGISMQDAMPSRPASAADIERPLHNINNGPRPSDKFFMELEHYTHRLLDKYKDGVRDVRKRRVRIALLDTGIASIPVEARPPDIKDARARIKFGPQLKNGLSPKEDADGHGTHCAGILLKVCPYADIYIYRVSRGSKDTLEPDTVAAALRHAVDSSKVDVVSMSFGWRDDSSTELRQALEYAKQHKVLMFAAASNEGRDMAFPARADEVIAIDAASPNDRALQFNPRETGDKARFTALGEEVNSAWPVSETNRTGLTRMTGTSSATPIAAATAALIIEFARQPPFCFNANIEQDLKDLRGMRRILREAVCRKKEIFSDFNHIDITSLFRVDSDEYDGGEWDDSYSQRGEAARKIMDVLVAEFGMHVKRSWKAAVREYQGLHTTEES